MACFAQQIPNDENRALAQPHRFSPSERSVLLVLHLTLDGGAQSLDSHRIARLSGTVQADR